MTLKIIGGKFKGHPLKTPKSSSTRPTQGMVREAVFNICQNQIEDARFLDLFAGSGAMGLEALSRGAAHATFIESNRQAILCIQQNVNQLHLESQTRLVPFAAERAISLLEKQDAHFDLIYVDPPYDLPIENLLISLIAHHLFAPNATLFIEERYNPKLSTKPFSSPHLLLKDSRRFGIALLHQYRFSDT